MVLELEIIMKSVYKVFLCLAWRTVNQCHLRHNQNLVIRKTCQQLLLQLYVHYVHHLP